MEEVDNESAIVFLLLCLNESNEMVLIKSLYLRIVKEKKEKEI